MPRSNRPLFVAAGVALLSLCAGTPGFSQVRVAPDITDRWEEGFGNGTHRTGLSDQSFRNVDRDEYRDADDEPDHKDSRCPGHCQDSARRDRIMIEPKYAAIGAGGSTHFSALTHGGSDVRWSASAGEIDRDGNYIAPPVAQSETATITARSRNNPAEFATATIHIVAPGQITATANLQVASYSISPGAPATISVKFGTDTNYSLKTWERPAPGDGSPANILVAGMRGNTLYHLKGIVRFRDGSRFIDEDQTFLTGSLPPENLPFLIAATMPGMAPQSGVELMDLVDGLPALAPVVVTDLDANILWSDNPGFVAHQANPIKLLSNGDFLINFSSTSSPDGGDSILQEVDLTGQVVWQLTAADLNAALSQATCAGCNITVIGTHHDFVETPNGHLILIAALQKEVSGILVTGDVLIDLDQNHKPVWVWNEFDHLDTSRHPMGYPDWTHTNAVIYSPADGSLIISMRHQNWLVKLDYANGTGTGNILWKLGDQGDFSLLGGTDPTDWFYAEHGPSFATAQTTGQFSLILFDNGNDRAFPAGVNCGTSGEPACLYSTVPLYQIDETSKTATIGFHLTAPAYSFFGGNAKVLQNGNVEFCETVGDTYEVTQDAIAQTVWRMSVGNAYSYRNQRMPSLYPGVQW